MNKPSKTLASILELIEGKKHTEANQLLLEAARSMNTWGMSSQEKLNYLMFASRAIQSGGGAKYGYQRVLRKVNKIKHELRFLPSLPAGGMLDLGCGTHDPLGVAAYFYLNGFEPAYCCDLSPPRNPYFSALSMYDIMANVRAFPLRYRFRSAKISEILQRWKAFDIETFEKGDFAAGVSSAGSNLQYHVGDIREFPIAPGGFRQGRVRSAEGNARDGRRAPGHSCAAPAALARFGGGGHQDDEADPGPQAA